MPTTTTQQEKDRWGLLMSKNDANGSALRKFWLERRGLGRAPYAPSADWLRTCLTDPTKNSGWTAYDWQRAVWLHAECWTKLEWVQWLKKIKVAPKDMVPQAPFGPPNLPDEFCAWWWGDSPRSTYELQTKIAGQPAAKNWLFDQWANALKVKYLRYRTAPDPFSAFHNAIRMGQADKSWMELAVRHSNDPEVWRAWADPSMRLHAYETWRQAIQIIACADWSAAEAVGSALQILDTDETWVGVLATVRQQNTPLRADPTSQETLGL